MDDENLTIEQGGLPTTAPEVLPFQKPAQFVHIDNSIFVIVSRYMSVVILTENNNRQVDVQKILENAKYMFTEGAKRNDSYRMQHLAASLREIICFIDPEHYRAAFSGIVEGDPTADGILTYLEQSKAYLSSVVHHMSTSKIGQAERLYPGQGYGQMSLEVFKQQEAAFLERVSIDLVYTLHDLFSRYCMARPPIQYGPN